MLKQGFIKCTEESDNTATKKQQKWTRQIQIDDPKVQLLLILLLMLLLTQIQMLQLNPMLNKVQ